MTVTRVCKTCGKEKLLSEFPKDNRSKCKECVKEYQKRWRLENASYVRGYFREQRRQQRTNPDFRARERERQRSYRSKPETRAKDLAYATNRQAQRQQLLNQLKDVPCKDCGQRFPPYCMDFDHVRGEKFKDLSDIKSHALQVIMDEVAKCEIVCANCHRIRTYTRSQNLAFEVA